MGLGLCLPSALQPRRVLLVYRKANALLQLVGSHRSPQRSDSLNSTFWQPFGADRWVILLIEVWLGGNYPRGLPSGQLSRGFENAEVVRTSSVMNPTPASFNFDTTRGGDFPSLTIAVQGLGSMNT